MANGKRSAVSSVEPERPGPRIDQYRDKIVFYLSRRVPRDRVEDFTQETLLNAYAHLNNGNTIDKPLAFLYKTAGNVVRKSYRDHKMAALTDSIANVDALEVEHKLPSVEQSVVSEIEFEAFCVAIARLPDKCRMAFVLRKVYQYSYKEIAEYCGVSVNTVKSHVKKGFKLVQAHHEKSWVSGDHEPARGQGAESVLHYSSASERDDGVE